jgi:hypothetical protein
MHLATWRDDDASYTDPVEAALMDLTPHDDRWTRTPP